MENNKEKIERAFYSFMTYQKYKKAVEDIEEFEIYSDNFILKTLDKIIFDIEKEQFIKTLKKGEILFRARKVDVEDMNPPSKGIWGCMNDCEESGGKLLFTTGYDEDNSKECPLGKGGEGRNNIKGMSFLYLAEDKETSCSEIDTTIRDVISVAEFEVEQDLKVIDFMTDDKKFDLKLNDEYHISFGLLISQLMFDFCKPTSDKKEYFVTQVIADHIRKAGFDGIMYRSFYTGKANYTIFNSHKSKIKYNNSSLFIYEYVDKYFFDCNENKQISSSQEKNKNETAQRVLELAKIIGDNNKNN